MRTNSIYIVLLFAILFAGCTGKTQKHSDTDAKVLKIDWDNVSDAIDYSSMVEDSVSLIYLETKDDALIGEVTKLICKNNLIYIADNLSKSIFVFDMSGKLQTKIHAVGNGPGEYVNISYFTVHNDESVIFDHYVGKLLFYDASGKFIRDRKLDDIWATDLFCIGDKLYLPNDGSRTKSGYYHLFTMDLANSDKIEKYLPFDESKKNQRWGIESNYALLGDEALLCFWPFDKLYTVKDDEVSFAYKIDFGDKRLPLQYIEGDATIAIETSIRDNYVTGLDKVRQSDKIIFLQFGDSNNDYVAMYQKETGEMQTAKSLNNSKLGGLALQLQGERFTIQDGMIIQCYDANYWNMFDLTEYIKSSDTKFYSEELRQQFLKLAQTDGSELNPILLIQNLKK